MFSRRILIVLVLVVLSITPFQNAVASEVNPANPLRFELYVNAVHDVEGAGQTLVGRPLITSNIHSIRLLDPDTKEVIAEGTPNDSGIVFDIQGSQGEWLIVEFDLPGEYPIMTGLHAYTATGLDIDTMSDSLNGKASIWVHTSDSWDTYLTVGLAQWAYLNVSRWCDTNGNGVMDDDATSCPSVIVTFYFGPPEYQIGDSPVAVRVKPGPLAIIYATPPLGKAFTVGSEANPLDADGNNDIQRNGRSFYFFMQSGQVSDNFDIGLINATPVNTALFLPMVTQEFFVSD